MPDWIGDIRGAIARLEMEPAREASLVEELSQHLTDRYNELRGDGVDDVEACRLLRAELNDGSLVLSPSPEAAVPGIDRRERMLAGVGNDVRQAVRLLRFSPGFAAVAILSLALGIGANTAIFELIDAVLMRTLPVPAPQQLADIQETHGGRIGSTVARQKEFSFAIGICYDSSRSPSQASLRGARSGLTLDRAARHATPKGCGSAAVSFRFSRCSRCLAG